MYSFCYLKIKMNHKYAEPGRSASRGEQRMRPRRIYPPNIYFVPKIIPMPTIPEDESETQDLDSLNSEDNDEDSENN